MIWNWPTITRDLTDSCWLLEVGRVRFWLWHPAPGRWWYLNHDYGATHFGLGWLRGVVFKRAWSEQKGGTR